MAVALEEVALWGLFHWRKNTPQITENLYENLPYLIPELNPIAIDWHKLCRLGFEQFELTGNYRNHRGKEIHIQPLALQRYEVLYDGKRIALVQYIHEIQRLWFDLFKEHFLSQNHIKINLSLSRPPCPSERHRSHCLL